MAMKRKEDDDYCKDKIIFYHITWKDKKFKILLKWYNRGPTWLTAIFNSMVLKELHNFNDILQPTIEWITLNDTRIEKLNNSQSLCEVKSKYDSDIHTNLIKTYITDEMPICPKFSSLFKFSECELKSALKILKIPIYQLYGIPEHLSDNTKSLIKDCNYNNFPKIIAEAKEQETLSELIELNKLINNINVNSYNSLKEYIQKNTCGIFYFNKHFTLIIKNDDKLYLLKIYYAKNSSSNDILFENTSIGNTKWKKKSTNVKVKNNNNKLNDNTSSIKLPNKNIINSTKKEENKKLKSLNDKIRNTKKERPCKDSINNEKINTNKYDEEKNKSNDLISEKVGKKNNDTIKESEVMEIYKPVNTDVSKSENTEFCPKNNNDLPKPSLKMDEKEIAEQIDPKNENKENITQIIQSDSDKEKNNKIRQVDPIQPQTDATVDTSEGSKDIKPFIEDIEKISVNAEYITKKSCNLETKYEMKIDNVCVQTSRDEQNENANVKTIKHEESKEEKVTENPINTKKISDSELNVNENKDKNNNETDENKNKANYPPKESECSKNESLKNDKTQTEYTIIENKDIKVIKNMSGYKILINTSSPKITINYTHDKEYNLVCNILEQLKSENDNNENISVFKNKFCTEFNIFPDC